MNRIGKLLLSLIFISVITACNSNDTKQVSKSENAVSKQKVETDETKILHNYLKNSGEFVVSNKPQIVTAKDVFENLDKYFVIDLRKKEDYEIGHVNGAVNVKFPELVDYMNNNVSAKKYDKIVTTCYSGQGAAFASGALRTLGYSNMYSMKFGMNAWNKKNKNSWGAGISNKYADKLEIKDNKKAEAVKMPIINTGKTLANEILEARVKDIFKVGFKPFKVKLDDVFENPNKYYIINYWPKDKYLAGHLPGAIQYTPTKDFRFDGFINTLPTDKPVVLYCYGGHYAANTVAYLSILGYDAKTIPYGANSFMNTTLVNKNWKGFKQSMVNNSFPMVSGSKPSK